MPLAEPEWRGAMSMGTAQIGPTTSSTQKNAAASESALVIARDLTDQMLASERLRDAQAELAHANRVATVGQLTASIAHEVNQPVAALVTNAHAVLRLLRAEPPDLDPSSEALEEIIKDGRRVSDVISRPTTCCG